MDVGQEDPAEVLIGPLHNTCLSTRVMWWWLCSAAHSIV